LSRPFAEQLSHRFGDQQLLHGQLAPLQAMAREPGVQQGAIAKGDGMAQAATAVEQWQPLEAVIERVDALEGPDPAHHLDGSGSGGKDDEVREVLAQVSR
jgi:hypothetical protein